MRFNRQSFIRRCVNSLIGLVIRAITRHITNGLKKSASAKIMA